MRIIIDDRQHENYVNTFNSHINEELSDIPNIHMASDIAYTIHPDDSDIVINKDQSSESRRLSESVTGKDGRKSSALYPYCKNKDGVWCILCARRSKEYDDEGGKYNPPMGHRHVGEKADAGAVRECKEESGLNINVKDIEHMSKEPWGDNFRIVLDGDTSMYHIGGGDEENETFKWMPIKDINVKEWAWSCGNFAKSFSKGLSKAQKSGWLKIGKKNNKPAVNDEGDKIPYACTKCGGDVGLYISGEPIYKCSDCGKYYGTMPFPNSLDEDIIRETNHSHDLLNDSATDIYIDKPILNKLPDKLKKKGIVLFDEAEEMLAQGATIDTDGNLYNSPSQISESKIRNMIKNTINEMLLTEGDDRLKKVQRTIEREFKRSLDPNATVTSSEYYVNNNPNTTWLQYLIFSLRHTFGLMSNADVKYLPLVANLAFSDEVGFEKRNDNGRELRLLGQIVSLIKKDANLFNQLNKVRDSITFSQVYEQLKPQLESIARADSEAANNVEIRNEYDIVEITSYKQAHKIGNHSCSESKLCYTQSEDTWNQYTANGVYRPYVCLKKGWEQIPEQPGENNPYDEYGTSMIFVFIGPDGSITTSNCRWNHHITGQYINGNVDQAFDKVTLAKTVGVPFDNVFKPYTRDELHSKGFIMFDEVPELLAQGKDLRDIFDWVGDFNNGFAGVELNNKYNFLRENGRLLSPNLWFDGIEYFFDGFAKVSLNGKYNFLRENGTLLSPNQWFDGVYYFDEGFARVRLNGKYNFIREDGTLLSPNQWFDVVDHFYDGIASVRLNKKYNFLRNDGTLLNPNQWFDWVYYFDNGFARVELNNKWNYLRENGTLVWDKPVDQWFDGVGYFKNGFAGVKLNGDWYRIDVNGNLYGYDGNPAINSPGQISESKIHDMIKNAINEMLLTEGDDRLKKVQHTIEREFKGSLDPNATVTSSEYYVNNNPSTTWLQYLIFSLRHTFGLMSNADVKYLPLVANLAFSNEVGFEKRNDNGRELRLLGQIVSLIKKDANLFNQLNKVRDSITFSQVYEQLKPQLESIARVDSESANKVEMRDDYDIIEITSYAQAHEIGSHSCSESKLCYTQSEDIWNQYTGNGINRPYVCLKKGWEQIPEEVGHNNPYDEYGTSMIFVFIGPDGNISASNYRWNHHTTGQYINGNVDQAFTKTLLAETVGRSFNSTFKPYTRDELHSNGVIMFDEVPELLAQGKAPRDIFYLVGDFENGFAWVKLNNKYNFLRKDGRLLSPNQWFDMVSNFKNGFARVTLDNKCNYLREDGTLLLDKPVDQWFDVVGNFYDGFARVGLNNKYNFLREDGTLLLDKPVDQWFDNVGVFYDGFAMVELNNRWNYLREDGRLLSPNLWFDVVDGIYDGFARISLNNKWNFLRKDGTLVWDKPVDQWFNDVDNFENGFAWVELNRTEYLLDTNGNLYNSPSQISESKIHNMIKNAINEMLLTEGDDRLKKVQRTIEREFDGLLDPNATVTSSEYYVNNNPNTTWLQYLIFSLRHTFGLMSNADVKYLPLVANLAFSDEVGFEKRNDNGKELRLLGQIVNLIKKDANLFNQLNKVKDSITFGQVYEQLKPQLESIARADSEAANNVETRDDYDIVEITSYAQAHKIGNKSCSSSMLCYTQSEDTWNQYTANGVYRPYVCLKKGWEQVPEQPGENNPYDEYGTSMIFVFIDPYGNITTSNCRWNHHITGQYMNGNVDQAFNKTTLAQTVGVHFDSVFKPYTRDELHSKGFIMFDEVPGLLAQGKDPIDIFDWVSYFENGLARVMLNNKWNFLREDGTLLSPNQWFDDVKFKNGFARVCLNGTYNFLRKDGRLLSPNQWFDDATNFENEFARVYLNGTYYWLASDGVTHNFDEMMPLLQQGKVKATQIFVRVGDFENGFARVGLNKKCNFLREDGTLVWDKPVDQWFDDAYDFINGFARVGLNKKYNFIRENGRLAWDKPIDQWFDWVGNFDEGFARVELNYKRNFLNKDGRLLSPNQWFDDATNFENGFAKVYLNGTYYWLASDGVTHNFDEMMPLLQQGKVKATQIFDYIGGFYNGFAMVKLDNKWNFLSEDGTLLSPNQWFDGVDNFIDGLAGVKLNDESYLINVNGNLYDYDGNPAINSQGQISENKIRNMIKNTINKMLLTESDDRLKKVQRTIEREFKGSLDPNATVTSSEYYVNNNPSTTWLQYLIFSLRHTFGLMSNADVKYLPLVANLAFSDEVGFEKRDDNGRELRLLGQIVNLIKKDTNLFNELNKVRDSIMFSQVYEQLKPQLESIARADSEAANNVEVRNDYDIVEITSYEQAHEIGNHSCSESKLCYTQSESTWNQYTGNGVNRPYACLKKGWKNMPEQPGENNPYDEYGTSMIFVFIGPDGDITTSNCRWNHHITGQYINGNVDQAFDKATLAQTVGVPFDSTFKPYDREYIHSKGFIMFDEVPGLLAQGKDPIDIFDWVGDFENGLARVNLNDKWNFLREDGTLLSPNQWFGGVGDFYDGFARARLNRKYNFLRKDGRLLLDKPVDQWFDWVDNFYDGFAWVELNGKYYRIDTNGATHNFDEMIPLLQQGKVTPKQLFDYVSDFENGLARVKLNNKWNFLREDGRLLSPNQWFGGVGDFYDGFARVRLNRKYNFIREDGTLVWDEPVDQWFDGVDNFEDGFAWVELNNKWNFLREDGTLVWDEPVEQWFDWTDNFNGGFVRVELNKKWNHLRDDGRLVWDKPIEQWFDWVGYFKNGFARTKLNNKYNFLREDGTLVWDKPLDQWFDGVDNFDEGFAWVELNGKYYRIDTNGDLYSSQGQISENKIRDMIKNTINEMLLTEGDDRLKKVQRTIEREFKGSLDPNAIVTSSEYYVNNKTNTTWLQYLIFSLRHTFGLMSNADVKYLPLVANLAFSDEVGFEKRNDNGRELRLLGQIVSLIKKDANLFNELNKVKDSITFSQVYEQLKPQLESIARADSEAANNVETRDDYDIVEITSYEQAHEIGNHSCSESKLCYTQSEDTWNQYTANGVNRPYACLKKGWEHIPEEVGPNNPYDKYGTSMIFVFIDPEGNISTSNCRWNHHTTGQYMNGNVDQAFDKATLAQTIGVPFDSVFKPYDKEYLHSKGVIMLDEVPELLAHGKAPRDIFDWVGDFNNGFAWVRLNKKYNLLRENGRLLSPNLWFDWIGDFNNGFARVFLNYKGNFLREDGTLVWDKPIDQWFDYAGDFNNGFAWVKLNGKYYWLDTNEGIHGLDEMMSLLQQGKVTPELIFDRIDNFDNGFSRVKLNNKWNFLRVDGRLLLDKPIDQWFDWVDNFEDGFAGVELNNKWNFLREDGTLVWDEPVEQWFDWTDNFDEGFARVELNKKWNHLRDDGRLVWDKPIDQWFDSVGYFKNGFTRVELNYKRNFLNKDGRLLSPNQWFDNAYNFENGFARVRLNMKYNFIREDGTLVWNKPIDQWFDGVDNFVNSFAWVELNGKYYRIDTNGDLYDKDKNPVRGTKHPRVVTENNHITGRPINRRASSNKSIIVEASMLENVKIALNESRADEKIKKIIINNLPARMKRYADMTISDIYDDEPYGVKKGVLGIDPNDISRYGDTNLIDYLRINLLQKFDIAGNKGPYKYREGIIRILVDDLRYLETHNDNDLHRLKDIVAYIAKSADAGTNPKAASINGDLNGLSADELYKMFKNDMASAIKSARDTISSGFKSRGKSNYTVVPIESHSQATQYSPYVGWCITYPDPHNYNIFTNGGRRFYFFLRDGYQNVEEMIGEGCPMDDYGLSMISIRVDMTGTIDLITTRWNHSNSGEFKGPSDETISRFQDIIGMDLYKVCRPYSNKELVKSGVLLYDVVDKALEEGTDPKDIFHYISEPSYNGMRICKLYGRCNYLTKDNRLLSPDVWFDIAYEFKPDESWALVSKKQKYNYINEEGVFINDGQWFDNGEEFENDFAIVTYDGGMNIMDDTGHFLFEYQHDSITEFGFSYSNVCMMYKIYDKDKGYNIYYTTGQFEFDDWVQDIKDTEKGQSLVTFKPNRYNIISNEGELALPKDRYFVNVWHYATDDVLDEYESKDHFRVEFPGKTYNIYLSSGEFMWRGKEPLYNATEIYNGVSNIQSKKGWNYLRPDGSLLWDGDEWFDLPKLFEGDKIIVSYKHVPHVLEKDGRLYKAPTSLLSSLHEGKEIDERLLTLKDFKPKDTLCDAVWDGDVMKRDVRMRLMDIADDFIKTMDVSWVKPSDIVITGSMANYTWNVNSDIDVHIVMDYNKVVPGKKDFVRDYFNTKKDEWNEAHQGLSIGGHTVEVYVEDDAEGAVSGGLYSLLSDRWLKKPEKVNPSTVVDSISNVKEEALKYGEMIMNVTKKVGKVEDKVQCRSILEEVEELIDTLKVMRRKALASKYKEYATGNIVWKALRDAGLLDRLWDSEVVLYDKINSMD